MNADGNMQILRFNTVSPSQLRPPGTCSCQKVNAIGLTPGNQLRQTQADALELDSQCLSERIQQSPSSSIAVRSSGGHQIIETG